MFTRGLATFLGAFGLYGAIASSTGVPPGLTEWGNDPTPSRPSLWLIRSLVFVASVTLLLSGTTRYRPVTRWPMAGLIASLLLAAGWLGVDAARAWTAMARGELTARLPLPVSIVWIGVLVWIGYRLPRPVPIDASRRKRWTKFAGGLISGIVLVPLLQILLPGTAAFHQPGEWVVVPGAMVHPSGRPSEALEDRMLTACDVFRQRHATRLICSGGPGPGAVTEPDTMRRIALAHGVPEAAIVIDGAGLNTRGTADNVAAMLRSSPTLTSASPPRVIVVSDFYHLPRVRLAFRQAGVDVVTVPAKERGLPRSLWLMLPREVVAWWAYLLTRGA
jgi:hypothetical protein